VIIGRNGMRISDVQFFRLNVETSLMEVRSFFIGHFQSFINPVNRERAFWQINVRSLPCHTLHTRRMLPTGGTHVNKLMALFEPITL
jgi:hypothetical protein